MPTWTSSWAQNENETVGFQSNHLFESGAFGENIDILNGGVNLSIPIGPKYQVSRYLSYQLELAYGSKIWDHTPYPNQRHVLNRRSNMGLGFNLHFGRIYRDVEATGPNGEKDCTWYYVSPDGNQHALESEDGSTSCNALPVGPRTKDTTYYEAGLSQVHGWDCIPTSPATMPKLYITSPDGRLLYEFGHMVQVYGVTDGDPLNCELTADVSALGNDTAYNRDFGGWYATKIYDLTSAVDPLNPQGRVSWVAIEYDTVDVPAAYSHAIKRIRDNLGRVLVFQNECEPGVGSDTGCRDVPIPINHQTRVNNPERVSVRTVSVTVPAFKASTDVENPTSTVSLYEFAYGWKEVNNYDTAGCPDIYDCPHTEVNVLTSITYPQFNTHTVAAPGFVPGYQMNFGYGESVPVRPLRNGEIHSRTVPTDPDASPSEPSPTFFYSWGEYRYDRGPTVALARKYLCVTPGECTDQWNYVRQSQDPIVSGTVFTNPKWVTATDPAGNDTVYHYRATLPLPLSDPPPDILPPLDLADGYAPDWDDGMNTRIEYYEGTGLTRRLVRTETREYEADDWLGEAKKWNVRMNRFVTTFVDDGSKQAYTQYRDWNDKGLWRETVQGGDGISGSRITRVMYRSNVDTHGGDASVFDYREVSEGLRVLSRTDNIYDTHGNLRVKIERLIPPAGLGTPHDPNARSGDIVTEFSYDADNNVIDKQIGEQGQTFPQYRFKYTYQPGGFLETKTFYDDPLAETYFDWEAIDWKRDGNTGRIFRATDSAGNTTDYRYDQLGRLKDIMVDEPELDTEIEYVSVTQTTVRQGSGNSYSCEDEDTGDFVMNCYAYDSLGRLVKTQKRGPENDGRASVQTLLYDALDRPTFRSEWMWADENPCTPDPVGTCGAVYDYGDPATYGGPGLRPSDPFGRVRLVENADGTRTTTSYFGLSSLVSIEEVARANGSLTPATTRYSRDVWGRLVEVLPPADGGAKAEYLYDLQDNLTEVLLTDPVTLATQARTFEYDALNRLHVSVHPENGGTVVTGYDALGQVTASRDSIGNLTLVSYDGAGRLKTVRLQEYPKPGLLTPPLVILQENDYDGGAHGDSAGKLTEVMSNDDSGSWIHTKRLYYEGLNGRLSKEQHLFAELENGGTALDMFWEVTYNPFGAESRMTYPEGPSGKGGAFEAAYNYRNGHLLEAWDASLCEPPQAWDPPGMGCRCTGPDCQPAAHASLNPVSGVREIVVPGNRKTLIDYDKQNRPAEILMGNLDLTDITYESGDYAYDGAGNISEIGLNRYGYDGASRLVYAKDVDAASTIREQVFSYDGFGNMTSKVLTIDEDPSPAEEHAYVIEADPLTGDLTNRIATHQSMGTSTFLYDARGNLSTGDGRVYAHDARNQVTSLRQQGTTEKELARYSYDAAGNRLRKHDRERDLLTFYVRDASGRLLSELRRTQRGTYTPEWAKHHLYLGSRLIGLRENRVPGPPAGVSASGYPDGPDDGWIQLSWRPPASGEDITASKYRVYRSPNVTPPTWSLLGETPSPDYVDFVTRGTWYKYSVTAIAEQSMAGTPVELESYGSDALTVRVYIINPGQPKPNPPTALNAVPGGRSVTLSWEPPTGWQTQNILGYHVYRRSGPGASLRITQIPVVQTTFVDQGLTNETTYYYTVKAINSSNNESNPSSEMSAVPSDYAPPPPPLGFKAARPCDGTSHVVLRWTQPTDPATPAYTLFRDPPFSGSISSIPLGDSESAEHRYYTENGSSYYPDTDTLENTLYVYWLQMRDEGDNLSEESLHVGVRTLAPTTVPAPGRPLADGGDGEVNLRIPTPSLNPDVRTIRVYRKLNVDVSCESYALVGVVLFNQYYDHEDFPDGALPNNLAYDYVVTSVRNDLAESAFSPLAQAIPLKAPSGLTSCIGTAPIAGNGATYIDGAVSCYVGDPTYSRIEVRWEPPSAVPYQPLAASTVDGTLAYFMGNRVYSHKVFSTDIVEDQYYTSLKPYQLDYEKKHCRDHPDLSCFVDLNCPAGDVCQNWLDNGVCEGDALTGELCSTDGISPCSSDERCIYRWLGRCRTVTDIVCNVDSQCNILGTGYTCKRNICAHIDASDLTCFEDADCPATDKRCVLDSAESPYLTTRRENGVNTSLLKWSTDAYDGTCLTATAVYRVYVDGGWRLVESGFADNFDAAGGDYRTRCVTRTPTTCTDEDSEHACPQTAHLLPPTPTEPFVTTSGGGEITVYWEIPGGCQDFAQRACRVYPDDCPDGYYCDPDAPDSGTGSCKHLNPVPCSAVYSCQTPPGQPTQACESRGDEIAGYYVYATEKDGKQHHFKPPSPIAATDSATQSLTFTGLAPSLVSSFRIATYGPTGVVSNLSPHSSLVSPQPLTGTPPAPASVKSVIWVRRGPTPGQPAIKVAWLPGATYANLAGYRVWRSTSLEAPPCALIYEADLQTLTCREDASLAATDVSTNATSFIDDTVEEDVVYFYAVSAILTGGEKSGYSTTVAARALPRPENPLSAPSSFRAESPFHFAHFTGVILDWCPNPDGEGVTEYRIYRSTQPKGPYTLEDNLIATIPARCLDGRRRCEILSGGVVNESTWCTTTDDRTCEIVDTDVTQATPTNQPIYYYVATAVRGTGGDLEESAFSEENQGRPNLIDGTDKLRAYDPDAAPEIICGDEYARRMPEGWGGGEPTVGPDDRPWSDLLAPYRIIGQSMGPHQPNALPRFLYFHLDHLGTVRVITDASGAVVGDPDSEVEHRYMPFGEEMPWIAQDSTNRREFTGHERDAESGHDYMLARYYSSSLGRFMAVDPGDDTSLEDPQSWNKYIYAANNPVRNVDPDGRDWYATTDAKTQTITVHVNVLMTGPAATPALAASFAASANQTWSQTPMQTTRSDGSTWSVQVNVQATTDPNAVPARGLNTVVVSAGSGTGMNTSNEGTLDPADVSANVPGHEAGHMMGLPHPGAQAPDGTVPLNQTTGTVMGDPRNPAAKPSTEEQSAVGKKAAASVDQKKTETKKQDKK